MVPNEVLNVGGYRSNVMGKGPLKPHLKGAVASLPNGSPTVPYLDWNGRKINSPISHSDVKVCGILACEYE